MRPNYTPSRWIFPALLLLVLLLAIGASCAPQIEKLLWLQPTARPSATATAPQSSPSAAFVIGIESTASPAPSETTQEGVSTPEDAGATPGTPTGSATAASAAPIALVPTSVQPLTYHPDTQIALLLGIDRESLQVGPTDTIILVIYNFKFERASLLSLPRDWLVYVPGHGMQRINTAYELGGIELLNHTLQYNLGIQASKWAVIHLDDFQNFVDDLGGVRVSNTLPVSDPWCQVAQGKTIQMSGYLSLCYVRSRSGNSDLARNQRQQQVFAAILKEVGRNSNLTRWPEFYQRYQDTVLTNISLQDMLEHTNLLLRLRENERVAYYHLDWEDVTPWQVPESGASVLLIESDHLQAILQRAQRFVLSP